MNQIPQESASGSRWSASLPKLPCVILAAGLALCVQTLRADSWVLDDPASPISAVFDDATGRVSVTVKATGTVWGQGASGGGSAYALNGAVVQPNGLNLTVPARLNTYAVSLNLQLVPATGELKFVLGGDTTAIPNKIIYPYPFFKTDGSGYAVLPFNGGFVVPTTATTWAQPSSHSRMEWVGGTDNGWAEGWMAIADPAADMFLVKQTATVAGNSRLGGAFEWRGSVAPRSGFRCFAHGVQRSAMAVVCEQAWGIATNRRDHSSCCRSSTGCPGSRCSQRRSLLSSPGGHGVAIATGRKRPWIRMRVRCRNLPGSSSGTCWRTDGSLNTTPQWWMSPASTLRRG